MQIDQYRREQFFPDFFRWRLSSICVSACFFVVFLLPCVDADAQMCIFRAMPTSHLFEATLAADGSERNNSQWTAPRTIMPCHLRQSRPRWRQRDSATSAAAWRRQRRWRQREAWQRGTAQRRQRGGISTEAAVVAAAQQRDVGSSGTVRKCPDAHTFECHRRADVRVFVLGQGRRDDSVDSIIFVGSDGVARGDVHRGR